jgi:hypothetical protein
MSFVRRLGRVSVVGALLIGGSAWATPPIRLMSQQFFRAHPEFREPTLATAIIRFKGSKATAARVVSEAAKKAAELPDGEKGITVTSTRNWVTGTNTIQIFGPSANTAYDLPVTKISDHAVKVLTTPAKSATEPLAF